MNVFGKTRHLVFSSGGDSPPCQSSGDSSIQDTERMNQGYDALVLLPAIN